MFNTQAFLNDVHNQSIPGVAAKFTPGSTNKRALLYVFTPSLIPMQMLRSYRYNFTENLVDELLSRSDDSLQQTVAPNRLGLNSAAVNSAIMPSANGVMLNTSSWSSQWTFVLIIDTQPTQSGDRIALASPMTRIIATGFCTEEPVNPATKTINPNAVLMFTKTNTTYVTPSYGATGIITDVSNASDTDIVSELNGQMANGTDLYMGSPQDIRSMVTADPTGGMVGAYGSLCLSNVKAGDSNRMVDRRMSTPKIQLGNIMQAIDSSVSFASASNSGLNSPLSPTQFWSDPVALAKSSFDQNVAGSNTLQPNSGIDTSMPMTMGQLTYLFGQIDVVPIKLPAASPWDSTSQDAMTARNSMSSLVSASLSNLVPSCGLANIFFTYQSFTKIGPSMIDPNHGCWKIEDYGMLVQTTREKERAAIELLEKYFEMELVPVLKLVRGDFRIMCYCDCCGYILVDLCYTADQNMNFQEAFYETTSRLGGFINPMIADLETLNHNATQLDQMVSRIISDKLGPGEYARPIISGDDGTIPNPQPILQPNLQPAAPTPPPMVPMSEAAPSQRPDYSSII